MPNRRIMFVAACWVAAVASVAEIQPPADPPPERFDAPPAEASRTLTGLAWVELRPGSGELPSASSKVLVYFRGWSRDGDEVMSNFGQPQPAPMELSQVFPVWREAIQVLRVGGRGRFWSDEKSVPAAPGGAPPPVIFDIQLEGIVAPPAPPDDLSAPPADAETTPSGARTVRLVEGSGSSKPGPTEAAILAYTGWTADGQVFDSTATRGRPTMFPLDKVMAPFSECVQRMVVGERRRCWIAGEIARGMWVGSPKGDLVFDIELVEVRPGLPTVPQKPPGGGR